MHPAKHLHIPKAVRDQVNQHFKAVWPEEGCGFLVGKNGGVLEFHPAENVRHSPTAYEMSPHDQIHIMMAIEDRQLEILSIIHSHPSGPLALSQTDLNEAKWFDLSYIIVSLRQIECPKWKGWLLTPQNQKEISLDFDESDKNRQRIPLNRVVGGETL